MGSQRVNHINLWNCRIAAAIQENEKLIVVSFSLKDTVLNGPRTAEPLLE